MFFFFQAEDGIRDLTVTGVQTCALPISTRLPNLKGPVPIGLRVLNSAVFGSGTLSRMCAGTIQASPHAVRNGAKGSLSRTRTVDSSGVSMDAIASKPTLVKAPNFGFVTSSHLHLTARALKGVPSCHATPFFKRKVYSRPFFAIPPFLTDGT